MPSDRSDEELARTATAPGSASGPAEPPPELGSTLGRYRLEHALGEGGMGVVHAAFDPDLERRVALKVLRAADGGGDEARQRLRRKPREIVAAFLAAGRGIAAAHVAGLVHRDFKPHNVLRRRDGRICVTDFGLARGIDTGTPAMGLEATMRMNAA